MSHNKVVFKKRKCLPQSRKRNASDESETIESECNEWQQLNQLKQLQSMKKRVTRGVNIVELCANSARSAPNAATHASDAKIGGLIDVKAISNELDLGNTFSVETNRRDEDTDLMKYIDEELAKRKGRSTANIASTVVNRDNNEANIANNEDVLFSVLPEHLLRNNIKKSEEMLSNQMLNGIPEVELGIDERIRNIEATEDAKMKLIERKKSKVSATTSSFVPNNIAVCFVHHNRFNIEEDAPRLNQVKRNRNIGEQQISTYVEEPTVVIGGEPRQSRVKVQHKGSQQIQAKYPGKEKASDDYIFEKFKKQFRKF